MLRDEMDGRTWDIQEKEGAKQLVKTISQERHLMVQPLEEGGTGIYHKIKLELISGTPSERFFRNNSSFCHLTHWREFKVWSMQCNISARKPLPKPKLLERVIRQVWRFLRFSNSSILSRLTAGVTFNVKDIFSRSVKLFAPSSPE